MNENQVGDPFPFHRLIKKKEKKMLADNTKFDDSPLERRVGKSEEAHVTLVAHPKACVYLII
jgi:hypothetical protein